MPVVDPATVERDLAKYYDAEAADRADRELDPRRVAKRRQVVQRFRGAGGRILEIGIGPGRDAGAMVAAGLDVTGVDLSMEHARLAARTGATTAVASVRALPFPDRAFGGIWTMSTLMHVPRTAIAAALAEVARVLAPHAPLATGVWGGADREDRLDGGRYGPPRLFSRHGDESWQALLTAHVGELVEWETWGAGDGDYWYQWAVVERRPPTPT